MTHPRRVEDLPPQSAFSTDVGIRTVEAAHDRVICELDVADRHLNRNGVLHGGALMTLADNVAGTVAFLWIDPDRTNVTIEAKTNFLRPVHRGDTLRAVGIPLHAGRRMVVVQVDLTRGDGKRAASVTQTHMVVDWEGGGGD